jgi:hypothetical protein
MIEVTFAFRLSDRKLLANRALRSATIAEAPLGFEGGRVLIIETERG